jgi:hypothetical protein
VRKLIDYGRQLTATVHQRAAAPNFALFARPFGTTDIALILARITNGLHRAAALEAALNQRAARGRDLSPTPIRLPAAREPRLPRQVAPSDAHPEPQRVDPTQDPRLASLPTEAEIAAAARRRPVGAVIADICRDFGIMPGQLDRAFWDELRHAIILYGGNLAGFLKDMTRWAFTGLVAAPPDDADHPLPAAPPAPATGPP